MHYRLAADAIVLIHFAFVLFVALGGFLVVRWPRVAWAHLPIASYGAVIEFVGFVCPLTPLENRLRRLGGEAGYEGSFVETYVMRLLYPSEFTRGTQIALGILVIVINVIAYSIALNRHRRRSPSLD